MFLFVRSFFIGFPLQQAKMPFKKSLLQSLEPFLKLTEHRRYFIYSENPAIDKKKRKHREAIL